MSVRTSEERIEELLTAFDSPLPPARARAQAEELVRSLVQLYGNALERIVAILDGQPDDVVSSICASLCEDDLLSGLLAVHGLHPLSTRERLERALDGVRPYIESHRGSVEVVQLEATSVLLRMAGSCEGCPSSEVTFKLAIERAIRDACPELVEIHAEESEPPMTLRIVSDGRRVEA